MIKKRAFLRRGIMAETSSASSRIVSIDALRGITILAMLFVNDVAGVNGAPAWIKHISPWNADGMTFADVVFPAFLFIVGMSIPFALERRLKQGKNLRHIWKHILIRTISLLIIGIFMVNTETISDKGILYPHLWTLLMYIGVLFLWYSPLPKTENKNRAVWMMKIIGAALLLTLVFLYRGNDVQGFIQMRIQWWGILGLIGWAYLVGCAAYLPLRRNLPAMFGVLGILYCLFMADKAGFFSGLTWINSWIDIGSTLGSHGAVVISGIILGKILMPDSAAKTHSRRIRWAFFYGLGLASSAILLHSLHDIHQMFIINKIMATAPWCLWSSAILVWIWLAVYWLMDVKGWTIWAAAVKPAGSNALFAYILAPVFYSIFGLLTALNSGLDVYSRIGTNFSSGLWRSLVFAFSITWLAGSLGRIGIRLKI